MKQLATIREQLIIDVNDALTETEDRTAHWNECEAYRQAQLTYCKKYLKLVDHLITEDIRRSSVYYIKEKKTNAK